MIGFNENPTQRTAGDPTFEQVLDLAAGAVGNDAVLRFGISWKVVEPSDGFSFTQGFQPYDADGGALDALDHGVHENKPYDFRPLPVRVNAPDWANGPLCSASVVCPPDSPHYQHWSRFARNVARVLPADTVAVEIWNEPNLRGTWNTLFGPNGQEYAQVFNVGGGSVHTERPELPVLTGSIAYDDGTHGLTLTQFLNGFFDQVTASALRPVDALGVHIYPNPGPPPYELDGTPLDGRYTWTFNEIRAVRDARDFIDDRPLWITETGFRTAPATSEVVSEFDQGEGLKLVLNRLAGEPDVAAGLIHRVQGPVGSTDAHKREQGYGLVKAGLPDEGEPFDFKLAYCDIATRQGQPLPPGGC